MDAMASMEITSASDVTAFTETTSSYTSETTTAEDTAEENTTTAEVLTHPHNNNTVAAQRTKDPTGMPTTTIPNPLMGGGRRVSQPGLTKLSIVVGLVTYGLILL